MRFHDNPALDIAEKEVAPNNAATTAPRDLDSTVPDPGSTGTAREDGVNTLNKSTTLKTKLLKTACLGFSQFCFGYMYAQVGVALPALQTLLSIELDTATWIVTTFDVGILVGSVIAGSISNRWNTWLTCSIYTLFIAMATVVVPWCPNIWLNCAVRFLQGMWFGVMDAVNHAAIFKVWGSKAGTPMQLAYFLYGLGGVLVPIATQPFLVPASGDPTGPNTSNATMNVSFVNRSDVGEVGLSYRAGMSVHFAFLVTGGLWLCNSIFYLVLFVRYRGQTETHDTHTVTGEHDLAESRNIQSTTIALVALQVLLSLMGFVGNGLNASFISFSVEFTLRQLYWTGEKAAIASTTFFITVCAGNLFFALLAKRFATRTLLSVYCNLSVISLAAFLVACLYLIEALVWICIVVIGFSLSVLMPAIFTFAGETLGSVSQRLAAVFLLLRGVGSIVWPLVTGYLMAHFTSMWYVYLTLGQSVCFLLMFYLGVCVSRRMVTPAREYRVGQAPSGCGSVNNEKDIVV